MNHKNQLTRLQKSLKKYPLKKFYFDGYPIISDWAKIGLVKEGFVLKNITNGREIVMGLN